MALEPVRSGDAVDFVDVVARDAASGETRTVCRTRNLVIGCGLRPYLPPGIHESARVFHSANFLDNIRRFPSDATGFAVVGAGQSAAEVARYLHDRFPDAQVNVVHSRHGYSLADDSPFANGIFDPEAVDRFHGAPADVRRMLLDYHGNSNYSVVDLDVAQDLHARAYLETVTGRRRLRVLNVSRVTSVKESADEVQLRVLSLTTGDVETLGVDAVVFATGYRPHDPLPLLGDLAAECRYDASGELMLGRDYRVGTSAEMRCGLYLHGAAAEHSHGLSAGLLSNTAVRAGEIAAALLDRVSRDGRDARTP